MGFILWIRKEYDELYQKVDCEDVAAARVEIEKAVRAGGEPILTVAVDYELNIIVSEAINEAAKGETKHDKGSRGKGDGKVRRGNAEVTDKLDPGSGDNSAGPGAGN